MKSTVVADDNDAEIDVYTAKSIISGNSGKSIVRCTATAKCQPAESKSTGKVKELKKYTIPITDIIGQPSDAAEKPLERIEGIIDGITVVEVYADGDDRLKYKAKNEVGRSKLMYAGKPANKKGWCKRCANHCANALCEATLDDAIPCSSHKV
jgi:hypothetical protein